MAPARARPFWPPRSRPGRDRLSPLWGGVYCAAERSDCYRADPHPYPSPEMDAALGAGDPDCFSQRGLARQKALGQRALRRRLSLCALQSPANALPMGAAKGRANAGELCFLPAGDEAAEAGLAPAAGLGLGELSRSYFARNHLAAPSPK